MKVSVDVPLPLEYVAVPASLSERLGAPLTVTFSLKEIVIGMSVPIPYVPLAFVEFTPPLTVGGVVSITRLVLAPREPAAPGAGSVRVAMFPAASWIVPPLRARAEAEA